ncbi:unnamed protein product [Cuscuta europaea]|uniref:Uncharacterized protein n=1 Tax=Cuscuta europaea TaxID=41803 RepID=A0A9P1EH33_CUSEU|nr:unnamed protein product [Cuscuta europaea]
MYTTKKKLECITHFNEMIPSTHLLPSKFWEIFYESKLLGHLGCSGLAMPVEIVLFCGVRLFLEVTRRPSTSPALHCLGRLLFSVNLDGINLKGRFVHLSICSEYTKPWLINRP